MSGVPARELAAQRVDEGVVERNRVLEYHPLDLREVIAIASQPNAKLLPEHVPHEVGESAAHQYMVAINNVALGEPVIALQVQAGLKVNRRVGEGLFAVVDETIPGILILSEDSEAVWLLPISGLWHDLVLRRFVLSQRMLVECVQN